MAAVLEGRVRRPETSDRALHAPEPAVCAEMARQKELLRAWMRRRWVAHCGRPLSIAQDYDVLLTKLRSGVVFDRWTFLRLRRLGRLERPELADAVEASRLLETLSTEGQL